MKKENPPAGISPVGGLFVFYVFSLGFTFIPMKNAIFFAFFIGIMQKRSLIFYENNDFYTVST